MSDCKDRLHVVEMVLQFWGVADSDAVHCRTPFVARILSMPRRIRYHRSHAVKLSSLAVDVVRIAHMGVCRLSLAAGLAFHSFTKLEMGSKVLGLSTAGA